MSRRDASLAQANAAAVAQRQRLRARFDATAQRVKPARLAYDAERKAEQLVSTGVKSVTSQARSHPVLAGFGVAAVIAGLFREPLAKHAAPQFRAAFSKVMALLHARHDPAPADAQRVPDQETTLPHAARPYPDDAID